MVSHQCCWYSPLLLLTCFEHFSFFFGKKADIFSNRNQIISLSTWIHFLILFSFLIIILLLLFQVLTEITTLLVFHSINFVRSTSCLLFVCLWLSSLLAYQMLWIKENTMDTTNLMMNSYDKAIVFLITKFLNLHSFKE